MWLSVKYITVPMTITNDARPVSHPCQLPASLSLSLSLPLSPSLPLPPPPSPLIIKTVHIAVDHSLFVVRQKHRPLVYLRRTPQLPSHLRRNSTTARSSMWLSVKYITVPMTITNDARSVSHHCQLPAFVSLSARQFTGRTDCHVAMRSRNL